MDKQRQQQIRRIQIKTRRLVHNSYAGAYHSVFKGRGMSYVSNRPYIPGDDVRLIDWKVSARTQETYVKQFTEERELNVLVIIDGSASLIFGTVAHQKRELAAELGAVLATSALYNNDKAGLMIFTDQIERYLKPAKSRNQVQRILYDILSYTPQNKGTDIALALNTINRTLPRGCVVFIISDFLTDVSNFATILGITAKRHEVTAIIVSDPFESHIPKVGMVAMQDIETEQIIMADTTSAGWQKKFKEERQRQVRERDQALQRTGIPRIDIPPNDDYIRVLDQYFQQKLSRT